MTIGASRSSATSWKSAIWKRRSRGAISPSSRYVKTRIVLTKKNTSSAPVASAATVTQPMPAAWSARQKRAAEP